MRRQQKVHYSKRKAAVFISVVCAVGIMALAVSISLTSPVQNTEIVQTTQAEKPVEKKPLPPETVKPVEKESVDIKPTEQRTEITQKPDIEKKPPLKPDQSPQQIPDTPSVDKEKPLQPAHKGTLIFVLDDAGNNLNEVDPFLDLPFDLTLAVLPGLVHSAAVAEKIRQSGKEVILHNPMQAKNLQIYPGPNSIQPDMSAEATRAVTLANLYEVGPVVGMNNHEGSLITESELHMSEILDICKEEGIYFLDSRTTANTVTPKLAAEKNIKIWQRSIFIDNTQVRADMEQAIAKGVELAKKNGSTILIGHVWSPELPQILAEQYAKLTKEGFTFSTISRTFNE